MLYKPASKPIQLLVELVCIFLMQTINHRIMNEAVKKINIIYYLIYTATIILTVVGFFFNLNSTGFESPEISVVNMLTTATISFVSIALLSGFGLFEINKFKWRKIEDEKVKFAQYKKGAILRLLLIGISLVGGVIVFYILRSQNILYCIAFSAIALIYSKPSEAKIISDLKLKID